MERKRSEDLIASLTAEARPVKRLMPPLPRALLWLALAAAIIAVSVWSHGLRPDLADVMSDPMHIVEWLASLATGIGAIVAAFHLSLPDRSARWIWLALVPAGVWLASVGLGCLADFLAMGWDAFAWGVSSTCLRYITEMGVPLTVVTLLMLRHAGPIRPLSTMILAALGMSALSAAGLTFFHDLHTAWLVLVWHGLALAIVVAVGALGGAALRLAYARRA